MMAVMSDPCSHLDDNERKARIADETSSVLGIICTEGGSKINFLRMGLIFGQATKGGNGLPRPASAAPNYTATVIRMGDIHNAHDASTWPHDFVWVPAMWRVQVPAVAAAAVSVSSSSAEDDIPIICVSATMEGMPPLHTPGALKSCSKEQLDSFRAGVLEEIHLRESELASLTTIYTPDILSLPTGPTLDIPPQLASVESKLARAHLAARRDIIGTWTHLERSIFFDRDEMAAAAAASPSRPARTGTPNSAAYDTSLSSLKRSTTPTMPALPIPPAPVPSRARNRRTTKVMKVTKVTKVTKAAATATGTAAQ